MRLSPEMKATLVPTPAAHKDLHVQPVNIGDAAPEGLVRTHARAS
jgi:hypothetical protein